jgi:hypothetical protein
MRIHFDSGGGVTGAAGRRKCKIDTETLPPAEGRDLMTLVQNVDLPTLANRVSPTQGRPRPDETFYEITVEEGDRVHTLSASDRDMPAGLRPLINWLSSYSIRAK